MQAAAVVEEQPSEALAGEGGGLYGGDELPPPLNLRPVSGSMASVVLRRSTSDNRRLSQHPRSSHVASLSGAGGGIAPYGKSQPHYLQYHHHHQQQQQQQPRASNTRGSVSEGGVGQRAGASPGRPSGRNHRASADDGGPQRDYPYEEQDGSFAAANVAVANDGEEEARGSARGSDPHHHHRSSSHRQSSAQLQQDHSRQDAIQRRSHHRDSHVRSDRQVSSPGTRTTIHKSHPTRSSEGGGIGGRNRLAEEGGAPVDNDTLSLITTFDDDEAAAAGWHVASNRYTRSDSGWLDFKTRRKHSSGARGGFDGDGRSTSSGFLSDFGSQEGGAPAASGWTPARDSDASAAGGDKSWRGVGGGKGGSGGGVGVGGGWGGGIKAVPSRRRLAQEQSRGGAAAEAALASLPQALEKQQKQIDTMMSLLLLQQQQQAAAVQQPLYLQQQQQQQPPPASAPPPFQPPPVATSGVPRQARASAMVGRNHTVRSMVQNMQPPPLPQARTQQPRRQSTGAGSAAIDEPAAVPTRGVSAATHQHAWQSRRSSSQEGSSGGGDILYPPFVKPTSPPSIHTTDALAEYDAVSRELRLQFLQRLSQQQQVAAVDAARGSLPVNNGAAAQYHELAEGDGSQAAQDEFAFAAEDGDGGIGAVEDYSGGGGVGVQEGAWSAGEVLPDASTAAAPAGSILAAVEQLHGSVSELQQQLDMARDGAAITSADYDGGSEVDGLLDASPFPAPLPDVIRRSGIKPPPAPSTHSPAPPPPPPPPRGAAGLRPQPQPAGRASGARRGATTSQTPALVAATGVHAAPPPQQRVLPSGAGSGPEPLRAQLLQDIVTGAGGGVRLRHVQRPSQLQRAAAVRV